MPTIRVCICDDEEIVCDVVKSAWNSQFSQNGLRAIHDHRLQFGSHRPAKLSAEDLCNSLGEQTHPLFSPTAKLPSRHERQRFEIAFVIDLMPGTGSFGEFDYGLEFLAEMVMQLSGRWQRRVPAEVSKFAGFVIQSDLERYRQISPKEYEERLLKCSVGHSKSLQNTFEFECYKGTDTSVLQSLAAKALSHRKCFVPVFPKRMDYTPLCSYLDGIVK